MVLGGLLFGAFLWLVVVLTFQYFRRPSEVPDRTEQPYRVYTEEFDLEIAADAIPALLETDGEAGQFPRSDDLRSYEERVHAMHDAWQRASVRLSELGPPVHALPSVLLLDMSGSMASRMPWLVGELRAFHEWTLANKIPCAIYGFTTRGWRGGLARKKWLGSGRPEYPGRLCALLHIVVADFDTAAHDASWDALVRADALRENVDGEALRWAVNRIALRDFDTANLVLLSDGAPVDDSSLAQNGPRFLWNDLLNTIAEIEASEGVRINGIGLDHSVETLFANSALVKEGDELAECLVGMLSPGENE